MKRVGLLALLAAIVAVAIVMLSGGREGRVGRPPHGGRIHTGIRPVASSAPALKPGEVVETVPLRLESTGTWKEGASTIAIDTTTYQWERCVNEEACAPIVGATGPEYTPTANVAGYGIRARVGARAAGGLFGYSHTGITPGVEPKYGKLYSPRNWWYQKTESAPADEQSSIYSRWLEEYVCWTSTTKECKTASLGEEFSINYNASSRPILWVPPTAPKVRIANTNSKNFSGELNSVLGSAPLPSYVKEGSFGGDKALTLIAPATHREWEYGSVYPKRAFAVTSKTKTGETKVNLSGAVAKGFTRGKSFIFEKVDTGVTQPRPSPGEGASGNPGRTYYVKTASESGFTFSATPAGPALEVLGAALTAAETKVGSPAVKTTAAGGLANTTLFKGYGYGEGTEGLLAPSPSRGEAWRWGATTGGEPMPAGIITLEDARHIRAAFIAHGTASTAQEGTIGHALSVAIPARSERMFGPSKIGVGPSTAPECPSSGTQRSYTCLNKTDGSYVNCGEGGESGHANECLDNGVRVKCSTAEKHECGGPRLPCYEAHTCARMPEGTHWRLKSTTPCGTIAETVGEQKGFVRALCFALKEYGAVVDNSTTAEPAFAAQEVLLPFSHTTGMPSFEPWGNEPATLKYLEGIPGRNGRFFQEIPWEGNIEVEKGTMYCLPIASGLPITKAIEAPEAKVAAKREGEAGCRRPAEIK